MEVARLKCKKTVSLIFNFIYILIWAVHPRKGLLFLARIRQVKNSEFNSGQTSVLSYRVGFGQEWLVGQTSPQFYSVNKNFLEPNHNIFFFFHVGYSCFQVTKAELSSCHKNYMSRNSPQVYSLALYLKKKFATFLLYYLWTVNCRLHYVKTDVIIILLHVILT